MAGLLRASFGCFSALSLVTAVGCGSSSSDDGYDPSNVGGAGGTRTQNPLPQAGSGGVAAAGGSAGRAGAGSNLGGGSLGGTSSGESGGSGGAHVEAGAAGTSAGDGGRAGDGSGGSSTTGGSTNGGADNGGADNGGADNGGSAGSGGSPPDFSTRCLPKAVGGSFDHLASQRALTLHTPINRIQWFGAHNSWNDSSALWANQRWSAEKLLESGIRSFDLDLHRDSNGTVRLCHGDCSAFYAAKDDYGAELNKFSKWLTANPCEILFIDLEDKVNHEGDVVGPLKYYFGDLLYYPKDKPEDRWETPHEMIERGKRVIVKSANAVYANGPVWEGKRFAVNAPPGYNYQPVKDFGIDNCTTGGKPLNQDLIYGVYDSKIGQGLPIKIDDTGTIDASNIPRLLKCGLSFVDADRWDDAMLDAAIWTWGVGEPNGGSGENCAELMTNGYWNDVACDAERRFACQSAAAPSTFYVTKAKGVFSQGHAICASEFPGSHFSVPQNALQNAQVLAMNSGEQIWLNFSDLKQEGTWRR